MANFDQHIDLIERYFEGDLNDKELELFQDLLENDPEFSKTFHVEKDIVEGIQAAGNIALRKKLNHIHKNKIESKSEPTTAKRIVFMRRVRMLAAVIVMAIIAGVAIQQIKQGSFEERTFMAYYETPSFEDISRGETVEQDALLKSAQEKFDAKEFKIAFIELDNFLEQNPGNENVLLMKGICQLETKDFEGAITSFQAIPSTSGKFDIATWYLGLSYLRQKNLSAAKNEFSKFSDGTVSSTPKRKAKAVKLLETLN